MIHIYVYIYILIGQFSVFNFLTNIHISLAFKRKKFKFIQIAVNYYRRRLLMNECFPKLLYTSIWNGDHKIFYFLILILIDDAVAHAWMCMKTFENNEILKRFGRWEEEVIVLFRFLVKGKDCAVLRFGN